MGKASNDVFPHVTTAIVQLFYLQICDGEVSPEQGNCISLDTIFIQIKNLSKTVEAKSEEANGTKEEEGLLVSSGLQTTYEADYVKDIMVDVIAKADTNQTVKV